MTDTTTTEATFGEVALRPAQIGLIARAEAAEQAALAKVAELEAEVARLRYEQITDGGDVRLVEFWEKAGRIADHADFCQEYDRLAEAMNGTPRMRDWSVSADVTITLRMHLSVSARTQEEAEQEAQDRLDSSDVIEAIRDTGWDDISFDDVSAERE